MNIKTIIQTENVVPTDKLHYKKREVNAKPEDKVDTNDALWLGVLRAVNNSGLSFNPNIAPLPRQHSVLACGNLSFCKHCIHREHIVRKQFYNIGFITMVTTTVFSLQK